MYGKMDIKAIGSHIRHNADGPEVSVSLNPLKYTELKNGFLEHDTCINAPFPDRAYLPEETKKYVPKMKSCCDGNGAVTVARAAGRPRA